MSKAIKLNRNERVVAVVPEKAHGPGWSNWLVWVFIDDGSTIRRESLQRDEMSMPLYVLFGVGCEVNESLMAAVSVEVVKLA